VIKVKKGSVDTEGTVGEICTELACAIVGVFDAINELDEALALRSVQAAIKTASCEIKDGYGVSLFGNVSRDHAVNVQVIKIPKDGTNFSDIIKEVEHYRKAEQGADSNAEPAK